VELRREMLMLWTVARVISNSEPEFYALRGVVALYSGYYWSERQRVLVEYYLVIEPLRSNGCHTST
jgi:hypothetical protein